MPWCCLGPDVPEVAGSPYANTESHLLESSLCQGLCFCSELRKTSLSPTRSLSPGVPSVLQNTLLLQENTVLSLLPGDPSMVSDTGLYKQARGCKCSDGKGSRTISVWATLDLKRGSFCFFVFLTMQSL